MPDMNKYKILVTMEAELPQNGGAFDPNFNPEEAKKINENCTPQDIIDIVKENIAGIFHDSLCRILEKKLGCMADPHPYEPCQNMLLKTYQEEADLLKKMLDNSIYQILESK